MEAELVSMVTTRAEQVAAWMNKADVYGYFEVEVAGESLGWFAATKDKITRTSRETVAEKYGERVAHAFDVNKQSVVFETQDELDELSGTMLRMPLIFGAPNAGVGKTWPDNWFEERYGPMDVDIYSYMPQDKRDVVKAISQMASDDRRDQPAVDTYDWMGGVL